MFTFLTEHWEPMTSLLLSIVAIIIAIWSSHQTSKDAARQIASIKELSRIQIDSTVKQIDLEIQKNLLLAKQAQQEWNGIKNIENSDMSFQVQFREEMERRFKVEKPKRDYLLYRDFSENLKGIRKSVVAIQERLSQ